MPPYYWVNIHRKRGRGWQFIGRYQARHSVGDIDAVRRAAYVHNIKVLGVEGARKMKEYRLQNVPLLSYA